MKHTLTYESLASHPLDDYDTDFYNFVGQRYRCPTSGVRVYETGMVTIDGSGFGNDPDRREAVGRRLGAEVLRIEDVRGSITTPDGRRVYKNTLAVKHVLIDGDVLVACDLAEAQALTDLGVVLPKKWSERHITYPSPTALPYSTTPLYEMRPSKEKRAVFDARVAKQVDMLMCLGAMLSDDELARGAVYVAPMFEKFRKGEDVPVDEAYGAAMRIALEEKGSPSYSVNTAHNVWKNKYNRWLRDVETHNWLRWSAE